MKFRHLLALLILIAASSVYAQSFDIETEANQQFITIHLHGFMADHETGYDDYMMTPDNLFKSGFFQSMNYFKGLRPAEEPTEYDVDGYPLYTDPDYMAQATYADTEIGPFTNLSHYAFADGSGNGFPEFAYMDKPFTAASKPYLEYQWDQTKNYDQMSDIFMEEIGDFNSGSRFLIENKRQCFISLAKSEWVYNNSSLLKDACLAYYTNIFPGENQLSKFNKIVQELLIEGPDFIELLTSAEYLTGDNYSNLNKFEYLENKAFINSENFDAIIQDIVQTARRCPSTIRIVGHSMGGMYTTRYLTEDESVYYSEEVGGFYKRNRDYTFVKYLEDVYSINSWPSSGSRPSITPDNYYHDVIEYMQRSLDNDPVYTGLSLLEKEMIIYNRLFRHERQNTVDKAIIMDSPLNGVYGANDLSEFIAPILYTQEGYNSFATSIVVSSSVNLGLSAVGIALASIFPTPATPSIIYYCTVSIVIDGILIIAVAPLERSELQNEDGTITPQFSWWGGPKTPFEVPYLNTIKEDILLVKDVVEDSPLVMSYKNADPPTTINYKREPLFSSNAGTEYTLTPDLTSEEQTEMHVLSAGAVPIMGDLGIVSPDLLPWLIVPGIFQNYLFFKTIAPVGSRLTFTEIAPWLFNGTHSSELGLVLLNKLLLTQWEYSTILIPESSSSGVKYGRKINPIYANPNATVYKLDIRTKRWGEYKSFIEDYVGTNYFPENMDDVIFPPEKEIGFSEFFGSHRETLEIMKDPIIRTGDNPEWFDDKKLIHFKDKYLWHDFDIIYPRHKKGTFPEIDPVHVSSLDNPDPQFRQYLTRNLWYYFNFGFTGGKTPTTISAIDDGSGLFQYFEAPGDSFETGLYSSYVDEYDGSVEKTLNYAVATQYLTMVPLAVSNFYPGLNFQVAINTGNYMNPVPISEIPGYATVEEYGLYMKDNEQPNPAFVYDSEGNGVLVSPHFKEGYNTVIFKFTDPFGRVYYKDMQIMQVTVPPFVKPVTPRMNEYIGSSSVDVVIQAQDIVNGDIKPENWFYEANFDILVDGSPVYDFSRNPDYTVSFTADGLSDGNHHIEVTVTLGQLVNTQSWRFWTDTRSPEISFYDNPVFSNHNPVSRHSLSYLVSDTVPFNYNSINYPVDTVFVNNIRSSIKQNGVELTELRNKNYGRMGGFVDSHNGYINDIPLSHGQYEIEVSVTDRVGNNSVASNQFIIDNQAPLLSTVSLNTNLVNLQTGLLQVNYNLVLDEWEDSGVILLTMENQGTGEVFTIPFDTPAGVGQHTLSYFVSGINVLKDGIYTISVNTKDALDNQGTAVVFNDIVIDRTKPEVDDVFTNPLVLGSLETDVTLQFNTNEAYDVPENLSPTLDVSIVLQNQYGDSVPDFAEISLATVPEAINEMIVSTPAALPSGKYFLALSVTDKNGNTETEYTPVIKEALSPEITYPQEFSLIDGIIPVYGNIYDPKADNGLGFDHYEVYYRRGILEVPSNLVNVPGWFDSSITVPVYQQNSLWSSNWGRFPVEGSQVIATLDASLIPEGDITVLVIAVEENGYRIGTVRSFTVARSAATELVSLDINEPYKSTTQFTDFAADPALAVDYTLVHSMDNPVDIYTYIKSPDNKIIKREAFYNQQSIELIGRPVFDPIDKGVYVYQQSDGRFYITFKNNSIQRSEFLCTVLADVPVSDCVDLDGDPLDTVGILSNEDRTIVLMKILEPDTEFTMGFRLSQDGSISLQALVDTTIAPLFIGVNKKPHSFGNATLYPSGSYPPILWDGKDEFGRYVTNGIYTAGVEAYGNITGYDSDSCAIEITTPFMFAVNSVDNKVIKPGVPSFEASSVEYKINKGVSVQVDILDSNANIVKTLYSVPEALPSIGIYSFTWFGLNDSEEYVSAGIYDYRVTIIPEDESLVYIFDSSDFPELGGIEVQENQNIDPSVIAVIEDYPDGEAEIFNGRQVVQGDNNYSIEIDAQGQKLPDTTVEAQYEVDGTQIVEAYPDMNYMAAFRTNYEELWAKVKATRVTIVAKYVYNSSTWGNRSHYVYRDVSISEYLDDWIGNYNIENNTLSTHNFNQSFTKTVSATFPGLARVKVGRQRTCFIIWCSDWEDVYRNFRLDSVYTVNNLQTGIENGAAYLSSYPYQRYCTINSWSAPSAWTAFQNNTNQTVTVNFTGHIAYGNTLTKAKYLSFADGVAVMGPDIKSDNDYSKSTGFANMGRPLDEIKFIDDIHSSTGINNTADIGLNYWRKNPRHYFYFTGEDYTDFNPDGSPKESVNELFDYDGYNIATQFGGGERSDAPQILYSTYVKPELIPPDFQSAVFSKPDSKVVFHVRKDTNGDYWVRPESLAKDRILYPFPATLSGFNNSHSIGDVSKGIPYTRINGIRDNESVIPNYVLPEANVYFEDQVNTVFTASADLEFDQTEGYSSHISLSNMLAQTSDSLPPTVNIKTFRNIQLFDMSGDFHFSAYPTSIENTESNFDGIRIIDSMITGIDGSQWILTDDNQLANRIRIDNLAIDFEAYNKYGYLTENRISDVYPFNASENLDINSMFHSTLDGSKLDNETIVIHPDVRDYSGSGLINGYTIHLTGIDGKAYQGLEVKEIAHMGKGNKLSDGFVLGKSSNAPVKLLPIYGYAEGDFSVSVKKAGTAVWANLPINKNDNHPEVLTYWNVTGLNGLYTIRVVSSFDNGTRMNVALKEVFIGKRLDQSSPDFFIPSSDGQATLMIPTGAVSEETVFSVDTVDMETLQDVAVLPDIAPVGEVIKLSPDGIQFENEDAYPQLQFIYSRQELQDKGIDAASLTIYNLAETGDLVPLTTIKQLYKVNYDAEGVFVSEEVIWDSSTATSEELQGLDYTYVKAWAVVTHFSYYVVFEGDLSKMPDLDQDDGITSETSLDLSGKGNAYSEIRVYVKDSPFLNPAEDETSLAAVSSSDSLGGFAINNIPLPFEGLNYLFVGHAGTRGIEYRKLKITRDTTAPLVSSLLSMTVISPDNNGIADTSVLRLTSNEAASLIVSLEDQTGYEVNRFIYQVEPENEIELLLDGTDSEGYLLTDGIYAIRVEATDELANSKITTEHDLRIDTTAPSASVFDMWPDTISPKNDDAILDQFNVSISTNEKALLDIWLGTYEAPEQILFKTKLLSPGDSEPVVLVWDGKNNLQQFVADGSYVIKIKAIDDVGNSEELIFPENLIVVDNTAPMLNLSNVPGETVVVPTTYAISFAPDEPCSVTVGVSDSTNVNVFSQDFSLVSNLSSALWSIDESMEDGEYLVTITAIDAFGNIAEDLTYPVEISHDNTPPVITLPDISVIEASGQFTPVSIGQASAEDQSPPVIITNDDVYDYPLGISYVTWTAIDRYGNTSQAVQTITVQDTTAPVLTIPDDLVIEATDLLTPAVPGTAFASDIFDVTVENDAPEFFPLGVTLITWTASDANGNSTQMVQTVTVIDTTAPELMAPEDMVIEASAVYTPVQLESAIVNEIFGYTVENNGIGEYPLGETLVTWTATDVNGNQSSDIQSVNIIDTTAPVLLLPEDILVEANGLENVIDIQEAMATDIFPVSMSNNAPAFYGLGTTPVTWTAIDANGNVTTGMQYITVYDETSPVITVSGITANMDYSDSVTPVIEIVDGESGIEQSVVTLDGNPFTSGTLITEPGDHIISIYTQDYAGNVSESDISFKIYSTSSLTVTAQDVQYSDVMNIQAMLEKYGNPVSDKTIRFSLNNVLIGTAVTDTTGTANFEYVISLPAGSYEIRADFAQDEEDFMRAAFSSVQPEILQESSSVVYNGQFLVQVGNAIHLEAVVSDEADGYAGDLSLAKVRFDINKIEPDNSLTLTDSIEVSCNSSGIAESDLVLGIDAYVINITVIDEGYFTESTDSIMVVVFDPNNSKATGGGWINVGSMESGNSKANFGFNVKYKDDVAEGNLNYHDKEAGIDLKSTNIEWLVITGNTAQFQGTATIKNQPGIYTFRVMCTDNSTVADRFTLKIWEGTDIYATPLYNIENYTPEGGNIVVHE